MEVLRPIRCLKTFAISGFVVLVEFVERWIPYEIQNATSRKARMPKHDTYQSSIVSGEAVTLVAFCEEYWGWGAETERQ